MTRLNGRTMTTAGGSGDLGPLDLLHYKLAAEVLPAGTILDDGCGRGSGSVLLARADRHVIAIDPDPKAFFDVSVEQRQMPIVFRTKASERLEFPASRFDAVVSFEVIEHLRNQRTYVDEIARVLKDDGILMLSTPNRKVIEQYYIGGLSPLNITHVRELYPHELKDLLSARFRIDRLQAIHDDNMESRQRSLQYQKSSRVPYRLRTKVPLYIREWWVRTKGLSTHSSWIAEDVDWETLDDSQSLRHENLLVTCHRKGATITQ